MSSNDRRATKAPPPISPVSGRSAFVPRRPAATPPKWERWALLDSVLPWEAAALFVGIEPRSINQWKRETFPDDDTFERFEWYVRIIKSRIPATLHSSSSVSLPDLASWAISKGMDIPPELCSMAEAAPVGAMPIEAPPPEATAGPEQEQAAKPKDWTEQARAIADEIDAIDAKAGAYDGVKNISGRVAVTMRERGIRGPRGPIAGSYVMRNALQGGKWKRKR